MNSMDLAERFFACARDLRAASEAMQLAGAAAQGRDYGRAQQYVNSAIEAHDRAGIVLNPPISNGVEIDAEPILNAEPVY